MGTRCEGRALLPVAVHGEAGLLQQVVSKQDLHAQPCPHLSGADCTPAEPEGRDVWVPLAACWVKERISSKVAASAIIRGGATGGAALALLYDWVRAVGWRAHYWFTINLTPLAARAGE